MTATLFRTAATYDLCDHDLIDHVRAGRDDAFAVLYERHMSSATAFARSLVRCEADADDLVAEAFTRLLELMQEHRGPTEEFRPYLLSTIRNLANDGYRREQRAETTADIEDVDGPAVPGPLDDVLDRVEGVSALRALASLPEGWKDVIWRMEVLDIRPRQLARDTHESARNISALAHRARQGLRNAYLSESNGHDRETCRPFVDRLGAHARGQLSARETARVDQHVSGCDACRRSLDAVHDQVIELRLDTRTSTSLDRAS